VVLKLESLGTNQVLGCTPDSNGMSLKPKSMGMSLEYGSTRVILQSGFMVTVLTLSYTGVGWTNWNPGLSGTLGNGAHPDT
jgi:hypothetical protein